MSVSGVPWPTATFTHSPCRGLAARRAGAELALAGIPGVPCEATGGRCQRSGSRRSAALMCDAWSSRRVELETCARCKAQLREASRSKRKQARWIIDGLHGVKCLVHVRCTTTAVVTAPD